MLLSNDNVVFQSTFLEPKEIFPVQDLLNHLIKTKCNLDNYQVLGNKKKGIC